MVQVRIAQSFSALLGRVNLDVQRAAVDRAAVGQRHRRTRTVVGIVTESDVADSEARLLREFLRVEQLVVRGDDVLAGGIALVLGAEGLPDTTFAAPSERELEGLQALDVQQASTAFDCAYSHALQCMVEQFDISLSGDFDAGALEVAHDGFP